MGKTVDLELLNLSEIAVNVYYGTRGSFLKAMADAWLKADPYNKEILKPVWTRIIKKYHLEEDEGLLDA